MKRTNDDDALRQLKPLFRYNPAENPSVDAEYVLLKCDRFGIQVTEFKGSDFEGWEHLDYKTYTPRIHSGEGSEWGVTHYGEHMNLLDAIYALLKLIIENEIGESK